ncbi:MAG: bifunctional 3-demethylubiquinol 3-O-methyltransferase/2-polyprenyl-6-hydroxyphenol methylase, partial [Alphaproteobacteria bacterium]|nr:bifunctional 3-demethylubiquinol 3-O-methyltransferase/2-polyprenyl-6-hydroxyphenol methylase [Alphaproteobacteria bacterium]
MEANVTGTASADEVARFTAMAEEWWDPNGKFRPLHRFNPVRLDFIREQTAARLGRDPAAERPFEGLSLLDIGCGGGLLAEPLAHLGFAVT